LSVRLLLNMQRGIDLVHCQVSNFVNEGLPSILADCFNIPVVTTTHINLTARRRTEEELHVLSYLSQLRNHALVAISQSQREACKEYLEYDEVIIDGIDLDQFTLEDRPGDYLLWVGRISPEKGLLDAVRAAGKADSPLVVAGAISDQEYFESFMKLSADTPGISYVGPADSSNKVELYRRAKGLLFPVRWDEPFGQVAVEAMACGTPVIAYEKGAMPELIKDGITGYLVHDCSEMSRAIPHLSDISRPACRAWVEQQFDRRVMTKAYIDLYTRMLSYHCR
jgi:glycosyltransferase involved in cell wall biosynthesis